MKCSHCEKEIPEGDNSCPFCQTPQEGGPEGNSPDTWVTLFRCGTLTEADTMVAQLEAAGISALIPDQHMAQNMPWHLAAFGHIRVQVRRQDLATAQALIAGHRTDAQWEPGETDAAERPLPGLMRAFALIWPVSLCGGLFAQFFLAGSLIFFFVVRNSYVQKGYHRRAKEWTFWSAVSLFAWMVLLLILISILSVNRDRH